MRKVRNAVVLLALAAPILGGCNSIFGHSRGVHASQWIPEASDPDQFGFAHMALGREALDNRQYASAIIAFRNAKQFPEHAAAAYNGLAIAYSGLGRLDLTERYFKQAVAEEPGNKRYQANLARFYELTPAVAVRPSRTDVPAAADQWPATASLVNGEVKLVPATASRVAIRIEQPVSRLVRVSAREVHIGADASAAYSRRPAPRIRAVAAEQFARRRNPDYPVKISMPPEELAVATSSPLAARTRPTYPIKVSLTPAK